MALLFHMQSERNVLPEVEEENGDKGKEKEGRDSEYDEQLSHVQEIKAELKVSEQKITHQELSSVKETLLTVVKSQVIAWV